MRNKKRETGREETDDRVKREREERVRERKKKREEKWEDREESSQIVHKRNGRKRWR